MPSRLPPANPGADPGALLRVDEVSKQFGGLLAVDGVSFDVMPGRITALIGPNGAGKTTLFNCITGFYRPTRGTITAWANGAPLDVARLKTHEVARRARLARTFQNIRLFKNLTVLENCLIAGQSAERGRTEKQAIADAAFWLEKLDLLPQADREAGGLPYGAQRRLEIARALCLKPNLLCLDEPAAGLNPSESGALAVFLKALRDRHGVAVLLIEHDMSVVMGISDHIVVLDHGQKIAEGAAEAVRHNPDVIRAYLGEPDA